MVLILVPIAVVINDVNFKLIKEAQAAVHAWFWNEQVVHENADLNIEKGFGVTCRVYLR